MSHDKWEDDKIEDLLSKTPKIYDSRSKEDVLKRLKDDGLFDDEPLRTHPKTKQGRMIKWIPIAVSIVAVFLLAILAPSIMNRFNPSSNSMEESAVMESKDAVDSQEIEISESTTAEESMNILSAHTKDFRTAVYPEELEGNTIFKLGLATDAADSLPITVLIPNERIQDDFGVVTPTGVELYNQYAPYFNESAIGFSEYHPYVGLISESGDQVIHTLTSDQTYDIGTAALTTYFASLIDTFSNFYEEVVYLNEDGSAFEFSEVGEVSAPVPLSGESTQYNYFKHTQSNGVEYLAPNFRETFSTVEEAINAMKEETNDIYQSVIIPEVDFEVTSMNEIVTVTFTEDIDLEAFDQVAAMQMVEGILLTASSFNMNVQFHNVMQTQWQGFDFTKPLPIPVGANEIPYTTAFQ